MITKLKLTNSQSTPITTQLKIKIQKLQGTQWIDYQTPVNQEVTIPANNLIKLDAIFNLLQIALQEAGTYRVHTSLVNSQGNILQDLQNNPIEASYEFTIS